MYPGLGIPYVTHNWFVVVFGYFLYFRVCAGYSSAGNALAAGVSDAKMKRLLEEDKDMLDFEEDYLSRLVSAVKGSGSK